MSELWQADLDEFFREYRSFRQRYAKSQTAVVEAIVDIVWKRAIREGSNWMLERVIQIGPAPPLDPHWNRARALLAEHPEEFHGDRVEKYWAAYAEDAANLQCLRPDERPVASALASLHLARQCIRFLDQWEPGPFTTRGDDEEVDRLHDVAAHFLRLAIQRCPQLLDAYRMLARLHEDDGELPKAAVVQKRLLAQSPDDYDAHLWLAHHYLECNDPGSSEPHVEAVFRLKPRDKRTESLRWNQRVTMIRALALKRQFEAARRELEALSQHVPTGTEPYTLHLLRAAIELKAKNEAAAGSAIDDALATVEEPTAIWAQLASIAARYKLPADLRKAYTNRFKQAVAGKTTSQTAGRLARLLLGFRSSQVNFTGRVTQERLLVKYLKRTGHVHWQAGDLLDVCKFLKLFPKESRQLETLLAKGAKRFPDDPFFHLWLARLEMERGPYECNLAKAQRSAQRALDAARAAASPDREIIEEAEGIVSAIEDMPSFLRNPFMADPEMFMPMFGDTYEDEGDYEDDEDDEGGFDFLPPLDFDENIAYEKLKEMAPRSIIAQLEQMALEYGMEPAQLFREMIANGPPENFGSGFETPPASDRRRGSAAKAKRRKR